MFKTNLRNRLKKMTAALLALSLAASLCPAYALASESGTIDESLVWSGTAAHDFADGNGSRYDPYLISTPEDLAFLAKNVNGGNDYSGQYFRLTADLYLNDPATIGSQSDTPPQNEWTPIGGYVSLSITDENAYNRALDTHGTLYLRSEKGYQPADSYIKNAVYYHLATFNGQLDGDGYGIYGLYLSTEERCAGLFGACKDATLIDLTLGSAEITAAEEAGVLVGHFDAEYPARIENCRVSAHLSATGSMVGGLVGTYSAYGKDASLSIVNCSFSGDLQAPDSVGGIVGSAVYSDQAGELLIDGSTADASITAGHTAGGIIGRLALPATLLSLSCEGAVTAEQNAGGIVGEIDSTVGYVTVSECQNGASLVGQKAVGGIIGRCRAAPASDGEVVGNTVVELLSTSNVSDIFGTESAGGIVGEASTASSATINLISCKNSAAISGKQNIGGIAGKLDASDGLITVGSSENYGSVTADSSAGGIVGTASTASELTLYQCSVYAAVTAVNEFAGGIAGKLISDEDGYLLLELSCSNGSVKAAKYAGGIAGSQSTSHASALSEITNCFSYAQLTAAENAGGIIGAIEATAGQARTSKCIFVGSFASGSKLLGGIAAYINAQNADAIAQIDQCYYLQSAATRPALAYGGGGSELCQTAGGLGNEAFKSTAALVGLDFETVWHPSDEENIYPTLRAIPFVWENFRYTVSGKSVTLIGYQGKSDVVVVPAKLGGMSVTTIDESAFRDSSVVKVVLPDSVTTIGEYAFADCKALRSITLSSDLRAIGASAFRNCTSLETKRSASSLADLYIGSDNDAFSALPLIQPVNMQVEFRYEDGSTASKSSSVTCYIGDHYLIEAPDITGYEADISTLAGICKENGKIEVLYHLGSYRLTIRYLYPDGSEAAPSYSDVYRFGDQYSVSSPTVAGYLPANSVLEGTMEGEDALLTVYYSRQLVSDDQRSSANQSTLIILLSIASFALLCCIGYFIFRYRSNHRKEEEEPTDFDSLFNPRF